MRVLITGGAGFIGSHLGDALLGQGPRRCARWTTSTRRCMPAASARLPRPRGRAARRRRSRPRRRRDARWTASTTSSTSRPRSAWASRCTRSSATPRSTRSARRSLLEEIAKRRDQLGAGAGRLLDVDLRRGPLPLRRRTAWSRRRCAATSSSTRASGSCVCDECGAAAGAAAHRRGQADLADVDLRRRQARPRGDVPGDRARPPAADRRDALLQRLRRPPGAVEPLHRAWRRSSAAGC